MRDPSADWKVCKEEINLLLFLLLAESGLLDRSPLYTSPPPHLNSDLGMVVPREPNLEGAPANIALQLALIIKVVSEFRLVYLSHVRGL